MKMPSHAEAFELLCLLAADEGRGAALFGDSIDRVRTVLPPFMVGERFPNTYLESPLLGKPFLDVNVGYADLDAGDFPESVYTQGTEELFDWYVRARCDHPDIVYGYVLDTNKLDLVSAGVYFQPRTHDELVAPFCQAAGEPDRAALYLDLAARMPQEWPLSYLGMFRGRAEFPLRVGGYLSRGATESISNTGDDGNTGDRYNAHTDSAICAHDVPVTNVPAGRFEDPAYFAGVFEQIGFTAYDDQMLQQISTLMRATPGTMDFQLDVNPDGTLSNVFSLEAKFDVGVTEHIRASFEDGIGARVMNLLESWGIADERWKLGVDATLTRTVPVELQDGTKGRYVFMIMPQWVKVRWKDAQLQPAKLYHLVHAELVGQ